MKKDDYKTKVVFRKFKDGEIIALFPNEPFNDYSGNCMSYMHVGQHGAADYSGLIKITKRALESDYRALKLELESIGYDLDVKIRK